MFKTIVPSKIKEVSQRLTSFYHLLFVRLLCELNLAGRNLKCPFVGIIDTAITSGLEGIVTRAPRPQIVATLHQVADDHVVVPGQIISTIPALAVAGGFIQVNRNSDRLSCRVHDANDCGSSAWRS